VQMEALMKEKSKLREECARLSRENDSLHELLEFHHHMATTGNQFSDPSAMNEAFFAPEFESNPPPVSAKDKADPHRPRMSLAVGDPVVECAAPASPEPGPARNKEEMFIESTAAAAVRTVVQQSPSMGSSPSSTNIVVRCEVSVSHEL